jgi:hypothetical protein
LRIACTGSPHPLPMTFFIALRKMICICHYNEIPKHELIKDLWNMFSSRNKKYAASENGGTICS